MKSIMSLVDDYIIRENIILPSLYKADSDEKLIEDKARELTDNFDLSDLFDQKVKHISGGQKQMVAIIRSLILNTQIILDDELITN